MITAHYFDGQHARKHTVELHLFPDAISLHHSEFTRTYALTEASLSEIFSTTPAYLQFKDGAHCEIPDAQAKQVLQTALGYQASWVVRLQAHWWAAVLSIVLMVAILFFAYCWGVPKASDWVAERVPASAEQALGNSVMQAFDTSLFAPSRLSDETIAQAEQILRSVQPETTRFPLRLEVRSAKKIGPNAFALPGGTIVLTDEMVLLLTNNNRWELTGVAREQLAGVFAHEIGHIQERHALRKLMHQSLVAILLGSLYGDFSAVASTLPAVFVGSEYSREMEAHADQYALKLLQRRGISAAPLADLFELLDSKSSSKDVPSWLRSSMEYVASHPATEQRVEFFRYAGQKPKD